MSIFSFGVRGSGDKPNESPYKSPVWKIVQMEITPVIAEDMLLYNGKNPRSRIEKKRVNQYCSRMLNGQWANDSQNICFDVNGNLVNGQHRLSAIVKSGKTISFGVQFGCTENDLKNMDCGQKRSVAQNLKKCPRLVASSMMWLRFSNQSTAGDPLGAVEVLPVLNFLEPYWAKYESCGGDRLHTSEAVAALFCLVRSTKTNEFGTTDEVLSMVKNYRNGQRSPMQNKFRESVLDNKRDWKQCCDNILKGIESFNPKNPNHNRNRQPRPLHGLLFYSNQFDALIKGVK